MSHCFVGTRTFFLLFVFQSSAIAGQLEVGKEHYNNHEYNKAISILMPLANKKNMEAYELICIMKEFGLGTGKSFSRVESFNCNKKALENYRRAQENKRKLESEKTARIKNELKQKKAVEIEIVVLPTNSGHG